ncbi:DMT family transporter [Desulfobacula sp.]|uniref:DMT family transporter n=1 Tax=Desulfobacula sp. TaxID=2593537 RepID=UPI00261BF29C|nr:DMT family transporter [Desulfobacula sp.]
MNERLGRINGSVVGAALVVAAAAAWGMSGIFVTIILENSNGTSVSLAFWRDTAAFVTLFLFTLLTRPQNLKIERKDLPWLVGMGFFLGGFHIFYNESVVLNGAAVTTVMQAAMPAVVTVAAFYLWKEELTREKIGFMMIIFTGTAMASGVNIFSLEQTNTTGLIAGFTVPFFYAGWTLCGKNMVSKYGATACLAIAFGVASIMLLPLQPFTNQPFPLNPAMGFAFCGLIAFSTFGAFTLYLLGMKYIQAGIASILVMSEILFAGVYAWFLLGERLTSVQVLGTLLVITGVVWLSYRHSR